jgi:hypothetical protein
MASNKVKILFFFQLICCLGCVPLHQQVSDSDDSEIDGYVGPITIDEAKFDSAASLFVYDKMNVDDKFLPSNGITYEGTLGGHMVYVRNCKCLRGVRIVKDKLIVTHSYGGGESNRTGTVLLWNGRHYQNSRGEDVVDVVLFSDKIDMRRALITEKKILDVKPVQRDGAGFVWINLLGYDGLIKYTY